MQFACLVGRIGFPKYSLTLIVKGTFDLVAGNKAVPSDEQFFPTGDEFYEDDEEGKGSIYYTSDFAYFKPRADLHLIGKCHAPNRKHVQACRVTFQVGDRIKSLVVFGNRYWKGIFRTISNPEPFTEMELRYENSYGGKSYKKNPVGKGFAPEKSGSGAKKRPLPNIEDPHLLIDSPKRRKEPAGFGPLRREWQQRTSKLGVYGKKWLKVRWPWFPEDFDWTYFNSAPSDLQIEGYLRGDEALYFENLHPIQTRYRSQLPGLKVRCFLNELEHVDDHNPHFHEVMMNLDNLWIDMEREKLVLLWRGISKIKSDEFKEIQHVFIASEQIEDQAKDIDYYQDLSVKQIKELEKESYATKLLEPEKTEDTTDVDEEIAKAQERIRSSLIAAGMDPDISLERSPEQKEEEAKILKELGFEEEPEEQPLTREIIQERIIRGEGFAGEDLRGIDLSGLDMQGIDFQDALLTGDFLKEANLNNANLTRANLAGADLSGASLKSADLREADFTGALLTASDLTGSNLENSIFENASLKNATLNQVTATGAFFSEADLSKSSLKESIFEGTDFSKCILNKANFHGANLREATVEGAVGIQVNMSKTDLTELRASEGCNFTRGTFQMAIGAESIWEAANLNEADFSYSKMEGADFSSTSLEKANLSAADMKIAKFTKANLKGARFLSMNLFQGSLEKADLTGTDFTGSNMYAVEFLDSIIVDTKFEFTNLKMTKLSNI